MDSKLLSILACPKCRGDIHLVSKSERQGLACPACAVVYPIKDGIPVLLVEEGVPEKEWSGESGGPA